MTLLGVLFIVLLVLKLAVPATADMSWWLVFAPILLIPVLVFASVGVGALWMWMTGFWRDWRR